MRIRLDGTEDFEKYLDKVCLVFNINKWKFRLKFQFIAEQKVSTIENPKVRTMKVKKIFTWCHFQILK